jgi:tetratricopeptide (TPR) repeat protein
MLLVPDGGDALSRTDRASPAAGSHDQSSLRAAYLPGAALAPRSDFDKEHEAAARAGSVEQADDRKKEEPSVAFAAELLYHAKAYYRLKKGSAAQKRATDNEKIGFLIHHLLHGQTALEATPLLTTDPGPDVVRAALESLPADKLPLKPLRVELVSFPKDKRVRKFNEILKIGQGSRGMLACLTFMDRDGGWILLFDRDSFQSASSETRTASIRKEAEKCALSDHGFAGIYEYLHADKESGLTPETVLRSIHERGLTVKSPHGLVLDPPSALVSGNVLNPCAAASESGGKILIRILETGRSVVRNRADLERNGVIRPEDKCEVFMPLQEPDPAKLQQFCSTYNRARPKEFEKFAYADGALVVRGAMSEAERSALLEVCASKDDKSAVDQLCESSRTALVAPKVLIHELFYGARSSLMGTVYMRPSDVQGTNDSDLAGERLMHSVVFVADLERLSGEADTDDERSDGFEYKVKVVLPASFAYILVPENLEPLVRGVFAQYADRIRPVKQKPALFEIRGSMTPTEVPDYESAVRAIEDEEPGMKLWAHAVRLPAPTDTSGVSRFRSRVFRLIGADRFEDALTCLDGHPRFFGSEDEEKIIRAYCCQMLGRRQEAALLYTEFLALGRDSRYFGLTREHIQEALADCTSDIEPIKAAMRELLRAQQWQGVIDMADQVLKRKITDRDALFLKGVALIEFRRFEDAAECFKQFISAQGWCSDYSTDDDEAGRMQMFCRINAQREKVLTAYDHKDWARVVTEAETHSGLYHPDIVAAHGVALQESGRYFEAVNVYSRLLFLLKRGKCSLPGIDRNAVEERRRRCARRANEKLAAEKKAHDEFYDAVYAKALALYRLKMGKEQAERAKRKEIIEHLFRHLASAAVSRGEAPRLFVERISDEELARVANTMPAVSRPGQPFKVLWVSIPTDRHGEQLRSRVRQQKDAVRNMIIRNSDGSGWTLVLHKEAYDAAGAYEKQESLREMIQELARREFSEKIAVPLEAAFDGEEATAKEKAEYARMIGRAIASQHKNTLRLLINGGFFTDEDLNNIRQLDADVLVRGGLAGKIRKAVVHFRESGFPLSFVVRNISIYGFPVASLTEMRKKYSLGNDTAVIEEAFARGGFVEPNMRDVLQAVTRYAPDGLAVPPHKIKEELELLQEVLGILMSRSTDTVCTFESVLNRPNQASRAWVLQLKKGASVPQKGQYLVREHEERARGGARALFRVEDVDKPSRTITLTEVDWRGNPSEDRTHIRSATVLHFGLREAEVRRMQRQLEVVDMLLSSAAAKRYLSTGVKFYDRLLGLITLTPDDLGDASIINTNLDLAEKLAVLLALNKTEILVVEGESAAMIEEIMLQLVAGADKAVLLITPDNADEVRGADLSAAGKKHDVVIVMEQGRDVALIAPFLVGDNGKLVYVRKEGRYPLFGLTEEEGKFLRSAGAAALQRKIAVFADAVGRRSDRVVISGGSSAPSAAGEGALAELADELSHPGMADALPVPWLSVPKSSVRFASRVTISDDIIDTLDRTVLSLPVQVSGKNPRTVDIVCDRTLAGSLGPIEQVLPICKAAMNMSGGDPGQLPSSVFIGPLEASPGLVAIVREKGFLGAHNGFREITNDSLRAALAKTGVFHAFSRLLTPYPPDSFERDQTIRDASYFSDLIAELRSDGKVPDAPADTWLAGALGGVVDTSANSFKEFLSAVAAEEAAPGSRAAAVTAVSSAFAQATDAGSVDAVTAGIRHCISSARFIDEETKRFVEGIVFCPDNPAAGWNTLGVSVLCELLSGDYLHPFETAFDEKRNWIVPPSFRAMLEEVKDIPNIGGIFADMPLRELLKSGPRHTVNEARYKMQGSLTELYVSYVLKVRGEKTIRRVNTPLPRLNPINEKDNFTEIDISLDDAEGIVEVKSKITQQGGNFDEIVNAKIKHLDDACRAGYLRGVAKKLCYVMSVRTLYREPKQLQETLRNEGFPHIFVNVTVHAPTNGKNLLFFYQGTSGVSEQVEWEDGVSLETKVREILGRVGVRREDELKFIVYAPEVIRRLTSKFNDVPDVDAWRIDVIPIPNIVFMRELESIRDAVAARKKRENEYIAALAGFFGVDPDKAGNFADFAGTDLSDIGAAVRFYGTRAVAAKSREELDKWIAVRKHSTIAGYLRTVDEMRDALLPYELNLVWSGIGDGGPVSNPKRKLAAFLDGNGVPLGDTIEILKSFSRLAEEVLNENRHLGYTSRNVQFVVDPGASFFVKEDRKLILNLSECIVPSANPYIAGILSRAAFSAALSSAVGEERDTAANRIKRCADELAAFESGPFAYLLSAGKTREEDAKEIAVAAAGISGMRALSEKKTAGFTAVVRTERAVAGSPDDPETAAPVHAEKTVDEKKWDKVLAWIRAGASSREKLSRKVTSAGQVYIPGEGIQFSLGTRFAGTHVVPVIRSEKIIDWYTYDISAAGGRGVLQISKCLLDGRIVTLPPVEKIRAPGINGDVFSVKTVDIAS